ncbi:MAG: 23S rRNA pseudouridine synthase [Candidatus Peregrinibacteria bacterium Gr01-1014_25]|nr:MAG: 23S rRNA pseudouridine synthase [Candidatus Peregrinibacteria bacterium Gr01-1014_25]
MPLWTVSLPDRLDTFLAKDARMPSRAKAQEAIETGWVTVNDGIIRKPAFALQEGDVVEVHEGFGIRDPDRGIEPEDLHLPVLYEDDACIVINKPAGIAVHPGAGTAREKTILHGAAFLLKERGLPFSPESILVHRLDRGTTGCLLLAKTPAAHMALQEQFAQRTVRKKYLAIVAGVPDPPVAVIDAPIGRSSSDRTAMGIIGASALREARTTYRTVASSREASLLACDLHTGRTHQLRVHLSAIGHPILGDDTYTSEFAERVATASGIDRICLHARELTFTSPATGHAETIQAPPPEEFTKAAKVLGLSAKDI